MGRFSLLIIYSALTLLPYVIYESFISNWISSFTLLIWLLLLLSSIINLTLAATTDPGKVYDEIDEIPRSEKNFCRLCELFTKPDRGHHCRKCRACVKRMDHHCDFINNCVGYRNQGHFVRFLASSCFTCFQTNVILLLYGFDTLSSPKSIIFNSMTQILAFSVTCVSLIPTTTIVSFLAYNQLLLLLFNKTTIEDLDFKEDREMGIDERLNIYDKGVFKNVCDILGDEPLFWIFPQAMKGDGIVFRDTTGYDSL